MRKICLFILALMSIPSIVFAVPSQPTDKSSFKVGVPAGSVPPDPTFVTSNIQKPYPTNKWFNSVIRNQYQNYSLNMYTYPQVFRAESTGLLIEYPDVKHSTIEYPNIGYSADRLVFKDNDYDSGADDYANTISVSISKSGICSLKE